MDDQPLPPIPHLPETDAAARRLAQWEHLHAQLLELHAQLEYVRLMLRIGASPNAARPAQG